MKTSEHYLEEMHKLHPKLIDLSLDRINQLLERMGNPHLELAPVVHVAGTNGKGSVLAFLTAILEAHGERVQRFSSPHLVHFHERINLPTKDGMAPISESMLIDVLKRTKDFNGDEPITFFEITTAAAFLAFKEMAADWCLLETGLGGRLDSTNVVEKPAATIITPVSYDHTQFLGCTLREIAREKAGILKPGSPGFIGLQTEEALDIIEQHAANIGAPLTIRGRDFDVFSQRGRLVYSSTEQLLDLPLPRNLPGQHQIENAGLALAAAQHILGDRLDVSALSKAMEAAFWPARMQRLDGQSYSPHLRAEDELWLDGGHNPAAAMVLADIVGDLEERVSRPLHLIIGMMAGKDVRGFLHEFIGLASQVIAVPIEGEENAMDPDDLADFACEMGFESESAATVEEALQISAAGRHEGVRILICGSLYLAGQVLAKQKLLEA